MEKEHLTVSRASFVGHAESALNLDDPYVLSGGDYKSPAPNGQAYILRAATGYLILVDDDPPPADRDPWPRAGHNPHA
jgi:hypothetical protein